MLGCTRTLEPPASRETDKVSETSSSYRQHWGLHQHPPSGKQDQYFGRQSHSSGHLELHDVPISTPNEGMKGAPQHPHQIGNLNRIILSTFSRQLFRRSPMTPAHVRRSANQPKRGQTASQLGAFNNRSLRGSTEHNFPPIQQQVRFAEFSGNQRPIEILVEGSLLSEPSVEVAPAGSEEDRRRTNTGLALHTGHPNPGTIFKGGSPYPISFRPINSTYRRCGHVHKCLHHNGR